MVLAAMTTPVGHYVSAGKLIPALIVLLVWARLLTWVDKDCQRAHIHRYAINSGMFAGLLLAYLIFFLVPNYFVGLVSVVVICALDVGVYLTLRNQKVGLADLRDEFTDWVLSLNPARKHEEARAGAVTLLDAAGQPKAPPRVGTVERAEFDAAVSLLAEPMKRRADRVDLVAGETSPVTYQVDGVSYELKTLDRVRAAAVVQYYKQLAGLDIAERRKPQAGVFQAVFEKVNQKVQVVSRGSTAGESMQLWINPEKRFNFGIEQLGFAEDQLAMFRDLIKQSGGVVLLSAPKRQGLTTLLYTVLRAHDTFMQHVQTVERAVEADIEGITQNALPPGAPGAEEDKLIRWVTSQEPDVVMVSSVEDPRTAVDLVKFATDTRRVYVGLRAESTIDAMKQWRRLVGDDVLALRKLKLVVNSRLARRLCKACKIGYQPDPAQLRKLNMNPEQVGTLFLARKTPLRDGRGRPVPCEYCLNLGYRGRVGVYETFVIDDEVRQIVAAGGGDSQLKSVFRKQHGKYLQEQALARMQLGDTSVEEVLRVLRSEPAGATASSAPPIDDARPAAKTGSQAAEAQPSGA